MEEGTPAFAPALREDAPELARLAGLAFAEDVALFGGIPPGLDTVQEHERLIEVSRVFKIVVGDRLVGGLSLLPGEDGAVWIHVL